MSNFFHTENVAKIISNDLTRPDFWFYNLNPATADRNHTDDLTAPIVSWSLIILLMGIGIFLIMRFT